MAIRINIISILLCCLYIQQGFAQGEPIGYWRSHLPYNSCVSVASDGSTLYIASDLSFYTMNISSNEATGFSKVDGMSDQGMACVGYDTTTNTTVIAYANSNIDLYKDGSFYNIPDLKLKSYSSSKYINNICIANGLAYLSTDIGIVVIDLEEREIKETYSFVFNSQNIPVTGMTILGNQLYACTGKGLYRAYKNSATLQAFPTWTKLDTTRNLISITTANGKIFTTEADSFYVLENDALRFLYRTDTNYTHVDAGNGVVWLSEYYRSSFSGKVKKIAADTYAIVDSFKTPGQSKQVLTTDANTIWIADAYYGLHKKEFGGAPFGTNKPDGPGYYASYDIYARDKDVWVMHGGYDDKQKAFGRGDGFSNLTNDKWKLFRQFEYRAFGDTMFDFTRVIKDNDGNVYCGSAQSGLLILKTDGSTEYYKQNSFIDPSTAISATWYRIGGFAFDSKNNLWMTIYGGQHQLAVKTTGGTFYKYALPVSTPTVPNAAADIIVDDAGQKWYATTGGAGGVVVFNDNETPDNPNDDSYKQLFSGKGAGGLADNEVLCITKDKNGNIWIGTKNGISIVNCPSQVISGNCEAENRIVQYDQFAGYLFQNEAVHTIAIDKTNRK